MASGLQRGLGLAMVFGAVESHGGAIECATEVGKGTTMTIYLPASEASRATMRVMAVGRRLSIASWILSEDSRSSSASTSAGNT